VAPRGNTQTIPADMGDNTFTPGTWRSSTFINVAAGSTVVLDGKGDPDSEFLFQSDSTIWLGEGVTVDLINGAKWENVLWACKSYFTSGAGVDFYGSILAGGYIVLGEAVSVHGCLVSRSAITFAPANTVTVAPPIESASPSNSPSASPTATPSHSPTSPPSTSSPTVNPTGAAGAAMATGCDADSN
jgi:hypothetical protein